MTIDEYFDTTSAPEAMRRANMSTKTRAEAVMAKFHDGDADLTDIDVYDLFEYIEQLESALVQNGHRVTFGEEGASVEHPVECRSAGLLNCRLGWRVLQLPGPPEGLGYGTYGVDLHENELVFEVQS